MKDIRLRQKKTVTFADKENQNSSTNSLEKDQMLSCQRHGEKGCRRCRSSESRDSLTTYNKAGRGNRGRELEEVMDNMKNIITEMDYLKHLRELDRQRIEMEKSNALDSVKSFRRQIMRIIDSLDEKTTKDTLAKFEKMADKIQADIRTCESSIKSVDYIENGKITKNVRFVNNNSLSPKDAERLGFGRQLSSQSENGSRDMERHMYKRQLSSMSSFETARDIKRPMLTRQQSVEFDDNTDRQAFLNRQFSSLSIDSTSSEEEQQYIRPKFPKSILSHKDQINKPAKVTSSGEHSVKLNGEKSQCNVLGSCFLPDGRMLLADSRNRKLKCLDRNFKVVDECSLPGQPWAVCCISETEAAVAMGTDQCIQLVSFERRLKLTKVLSIQDDCFGIAFSKGEYFVTSHHVVNVYDKLGQHLRTFHKDHCGNDIFYGTYDIAASADGSKLYVADCKRNLIILNREGDVLSVYSDAEMKDAWGVCTDYLGNVFVCGYWSHNVIQLTPEGRKVAVVLDKSTGLKNPKSVCFDPCRSKFVVSKDSNSILVFDVRHT